MRHGGRIQLIRAPGLGNRPAGRAHVEGTQQQSGLEGSEANARARGVACGQRVYGTVDAACTSAICTRWGAARTCGRGAAS